ncbi:chromosomal replication initiator protein DnaA [Methylovirgula sp. 4M-Z18]|uniref:chromosomal replication initiator protein DnaA n=1 Tax=Methylovirgula sp. 4M-Z18 TaxID=2293567 RepID=UPI000E2F1BF6|nr:chromosomal replication initiator protein DnaA [Methylovirgula sp. 4M-Z18]RFB78541.1 chromosomal replication initiator protein DnaA [Methylovirgula sp. 4M-Z18]
MFKSQAAAAHTPVLSLESADEDSAPNEKEIWHRAGRRLKAELGEETFNAWFGRVELDAICAGTAELSVPTRFLKSWIESHYTDKLVAALAAEHREIKTLHVNLRSAVSRPAAPPRLVRGAEMAAAVPHKALEVAADAAERALHRAASSAPRAPSAKVTAATEVDGLSGSPLDRRLSFGSFLIGRSNQLAHAAAQNVANGKPGDPALYNPLYIHASVGLGKTHLLQAVAHAASEQRRRVIYLTAEKFMYGFVSALKAQTAIAFKEKLRAIDVLIIDDVQFLQGKQIQQEFCHTLNALMDAGRQIVIAADRPPSDLEALEERVRSRLACGLCVEMGALDEALRVKILETRIQAAKATQPGFDVPNAVVSYVAHAITTNGRDLDGAVNRLLAHTTLSGAPLSVETAENAIRDLIRTREPKRVKIEDIQKLVANHYNVSRADILSSRRTATVVRPRQIAMFLSKVLTLRSLPEIGRRFGGRDHTTVLHAVRKIEGLTGADKSLSDEIELLKRMLLE